MTTIAWDGKTLAADRRVNFGTASFATTQKIYRRKDGALIGGIGGTGICSEYIRWFLAGEKGKTSPKLRDADGKDTIMIIVYPSGKLEMRDDDGRYEITADKTAIGSGGEVALGALMAGATALEAVAIAAKVDGYTGPEIDVLELVPKKAKL